MNDEISDRTGARKRIRVLIADDSAPFRSALQLLLDRLAHVEVVGAAEDGRHALTWVSSTRLDLVLMDVKMPRLNGLEAARRIRADFPGVRVIMMALHDSEALRAACAAAGADAFIPKRCLRKDLPGAIARLFPGRAGGANEQQP